MSREYCSCSIFPKKFFVCRKCRNTLKPLNCFILVTVHLLPGSNHTTKLCVLFKCFSPLYDADARTAHHRPHNRKRSAFNENHESSSRRLTTTKRRSWPKPWIWTATCCWMTTQSLSLLATASGSRHSAARWGFLKRNFLNCWG